MSKLIKIINAEEQMKDLYCECCGKEPVERLYRVATPGFPEINLCRGSYLEEMGTAAEPNEKTAA